MGLIPEKFLSEIEFGLAVEVETGIADEWFAQAKSVAQSVRVSGQTIEAPTRGGPDNAGLHFWVTAGGKRLDGFDFWVSAELTDEAGNPNGRQMVYADWDDALVDRVDKIMNNLGGLVSMAWKSRKLDRGGCSAYPAFRAFADSMQQRILSTDSTAKKH